MYGVTLLLALELSRSTAMYAVHLHATHNNHSTVDPSARAVQVWEQL